MVDLFATHLNHKLPIYVSPVPDKKALKIDALNFHCVNTSYLPDDSYSPAPAGPAKRKKRRPGFHPGQDRYTTLHSPGGLVPASLARGT